MSSSPCVSALSLTSFSAASPPISISTTPACARAAFSESSSGTRVMPKPDWLADVAATPPSGGRVGANSGGTCGHAVGSAASIRPAATRRRRSAGVSGPNTSVMATTLRSPVHSSTICRSRKAMWPRRAASACRPASVLRYTRLRSSASGPMGEGWALRMGVMVGSMRTSVDGKTGSRLYDPFVNFGQYAQSMHFPRHPFEGAIRRRASAG